MSVVKGTMNRVELLGNLGADPEMRFTPGGTAVCKFRVATKRHAGRNAAGEREFETDWTTVEAWDRLAERCSAALHKGSRVMVVGSLRTDVWEDRETGHRRSKMFVRADEIVFLDPRPGAADRLVSAAVEAEDDEDLSF